MIDQPLFSVAGNPCNKPSSLPASLMLLQSVFHRIEINESEKLLWLWLTLHSLQSQNGSCHFSYQQLATLLEWRVDTIHRALLRLRLMGFLKCDLPFLHGIVTPKDAEMVHKLIPTQPEFEEAVKREITINLLKNHKGKQHVETIKRS